MSCLFISGLSYINFEGVVACEDANGDFYGVGVYNNIFNPEVSPLFSPFEDVESFTAIFQVQSTAHMNILFHCLSCLPE